jgi:hypothetical protein
MNECPKLGSGKVALDVCKWVFAVIKLPVGFARERGQRLSRDLSAR